MKMQPGSYMTPNTQQQAPPAPNASFQQSHFQTQPLAQQYQGQQQAAPQLQRQAPTPEPPKPKQPLPEEYVYLQTVFNELRIQCINTASNPVSYYFIHKNIFSVFQQYFLSISANETKIRRCSQAIRKPL